MVAHQVELDLAQAKQGPNVPRCMAFAKHEKGKSYLAQVGEICALAFGPGRLTAQDYYYYRPYDDELFDPSEKKRFLSEGAHEAIVRRCSDSRWWGMADDKLTAYTILRSHGIATPTVQAVYEPGYRKTGVRTCRNAAELAAFLRGDARYPLFAKLVSGAASFGAWSIERYDDEADRLLLYGGGRLTVDNFVERIVAVEGDGYLFEDRLLPHPAVRAICGERVATLRVIAIASKAGPELLHFVWKIPVGANVADNFWRPGNMLGAVDTASGKVLRVVQGTGPDQVEVDVHPDTGKLIRDVVLPDWDRVKRLCRDCAAIFSKLRYHSYDVALCPDGPVIVEVNSGGAFLLPQLATGRGFLDERFTAFLRDRKA